VLEQQRSGTGGQTCGMDALELPRGPWARWGMMNAAWPERMAFQSVKCAKQEWAKNVPFRSENLLVLATE
jgi:hypothetical protein